MTCKDCIHYDICESHKNELFHAFGVTSYSMNPESCKDFKDHSRFIELPCKVGDTVFVIINSNMYRLEQVDNIYMYSDVIEFETEYDNCFSLKDIGEKVFLNIEEANQAVKKRNI